MSGRVLGRLPPQATFSLLVGVAGLLISVGTACTGSSGVAGASTTSSSIRVIVQPDNPRRPYFITAIDYHFHDAHPTPPLAPDRTIVVTNQGRNTHNVSVPGTNYSKDIAPGDKIVIHDIGKLFGGPGTHYFICKYHVNLGMKGTVIIANP